MNWIVMDIGCIECQIESGLVGVFDDKENADAIAAILNGIEEEDGFRPQHIFEVFELPELNVMNSNYEIKTTKLK